jgi:hypothetical protein
VSITAIRLLHTIKAQKSEISRLNNMWCSTPPRKRKRGRPSKRQYHLKYWSLKTCIPVVAQSVWWLGYRLYDWGSIPSTSRIFLFATATAHTTSYKTCTGGGAVSPEVTRPERKADHSPPSMMRLRMRGGIPPLPQYVSMAWYLIKQRMHLLGMVLSYT